VLDVDRGIVHGRGLLERRVVGRGGRAGRYTDQSDPSGNQCSDYDFAHSLFLLCPNGQLLSDAITVRHSRGFIHRGSSTRILAASRPLGQSQSGVFDELMQVDERQMNGRFFDNGR
jgi:hypothetical protein